MYIILTVHLLQKILFLVKTLCQNLTHNLSIEMYMEDSGGGFAGEQELMSQFGLQNLSEATFVVSKTKFQEKTKQIQIEKVQTQLDLVQFNWSLVR